MPSEEQRNIWKGEIETDWPGDKPKDRLFRLYILEVKETGYLEGMNDNLRDTLERFRGMFEFEECTCDDGEDDDYGVKGENLNLNPRIDPSTKSVPELSEEERTKLEGLWPKD